MYIERAFELFSEFPADPENNSAVYLEKLALKNWQFSCTPRVAAKLITLLLFSIVNSSFRSSELTLHLVYHYVALFSLFYF